MGTPHRGSIGADRGAIAAQVLRFFALRSVPNILMAIRYDSHELRDMHRQFEAVISPNLILVNFFETEKFPQFLGYWNEYVSLASNADMQSANILMNFCQGVTEASATLDGPKLENLALHTHHTGLNKYWRRDSEYKRVSGKLVSLMETIFQGM